MVRRIYLTDQHSESVKPSWFGESIGHYENGDTLVIDTVERYKVSADGRMLEAAVSMKLFLVDSPTTCSFSLWGVR